MAEIENLDGMDGSMGRSIAILYQRWFRQPRKCGAGF